jgi:rhodanese-related sulfurtransferase
MDRYIEFVTNHWILFIALVAVTFFLIQDLLESVLQKFESISPMLAVAKMNSADIVIIDVREIDEFVKGHIENAKNIPASKFSDKIAELEKYKNSPILVVCQTGTRSTQACRQLIKAGFENIFHMKGGMQSWEDNKLPISKVKK